MLPNLGLKFPKTSSSSTNPSTEDTSSPIRPSKFFQLSAQKFISSTNANSKSKTLHFKKFQKLAKQRKNANPPENKDQPMFQNLITLDKNCQFLKELKQMQEKIYPNQAGSLPASICYSISDENLAVKNINVGVIYNLIYLENYNYYNLQLGILLKNYSQDLKSHIKILKSNHKFESKILIKILMQMISGISWLHFGVRFMTSLGVEKSGQISSRKRRKNYV